MLEACNANMTSLSIDIVHSLLKSQTSFQAGELKHFLPQWQAITTDATILLIVTGVKLEFKNGVAPMQHYGRPSVFNSHLSTLKLLNFSSKGSLCRQHRKHRNLFPQYFYDLKKMPRTAPFLIFKRVMNL